MRAPRTEEQVIWLHQLAPAKPAMGQACNGCGVCCALEPCPVAMVFLWQRTGRCRALEWHEDAAQYRCGMLLGPERYVPALPRFLRGVMRRMVGRWIAAGTACDARDG